MNSTRYSVTKNAPINSVEIISMVSRLNKDIADMQESLYDTVGYISNGAVMGMWLSYDGINLTIESGSVSYEGYTMPFPLTVIELAIADGDYIIFENREISASAEKTGIIIGRYVGGTFDYSVRSANSPLSTVDIVDNISAAYSSDADYVYVKSSNEMYVTAPAVSDEMLSVVDRSSNFNAVTNGIINIARAKISVSGYITAITKVKGNALIECESPIQASIIINNSNGIKYDFVPNSEDMIYVDIIRDCAVTTDADVKFRIFSDSPFYLHYSELYAG